MKDFTELRVSEKDSIVDIVDKESNAIYAEERLYR